MRVACRMVDLLVWKMNIYHKTIYFPNFFSRLLPPNIWNFIVNEWRLNARMIAAARNRRKTHKEWCEWDLWIRYVIACVKQSFFDFYCVSNADIIWTNPILLLLANAHANETQVAMTNEQKKKSRIFFPTLPTDFSTAYLVIDQFADILYFIVRFGVSCVKRILIYRPSFLKWPQRHFLQFIFIDLRHTVGACWRDCGTDTWRPECVNRSIILFRWTWHVWSSHQSTGTSLQKRKTHANSWPWSTWNLSLTTK